MIRSNPWRLGNSSSRAPTLRPGPTHWQAWSHRHWQSESGTATWHWQCTQAATGSVRVPGTLPLATRSWPCDVQVRRCIQTSSRSPVPRRLRHGRTRRQARSTCATKRICPEKCSHTGNTRCPHPRPWHSHFLFVTSTRKVCSANSRWQAMVATGAGSRSGVSHTPSQSRPQ